MVLRQAPNGLRYLRVGGVGSVREQEKLEARKRLVNRAESHTSGARFVGTLLTLEIYDFAICILIASSINSRPKTSTLFEPKLLF